MRANRASPCTRRIVWKPSTNGIVEIAKAARVSAAAACIAWRQVPRAQLGYLLVVLGQDLTTPWSHRPRGAGDRYAHFEGELEPGWVCARLGFY